MSSPAYSRAALIPGDIYATDARTLLDAVRDFIRNAGDGYNRATLDVGFRRLATSHGVAPTTLFKMLRVALAWPMASPDLYETIVALGPAECAQRLNAAIVYLSDVAQA